MRASLDLSQAEALFKAYSGQFFHIYREEGPEIHEAYRKLNISRQQELIWIDELVANQVLLLQTLDQEDARQAYMKDGEDWSWTLVQRLVDMAGNYPEKWPPVIEHMKKFSGKISRQGRLIIAESLLGRNALQYRGGPIFKAADNSDQDLCENLLNLAEALLSEAEQGYGDQDRLLRAKQRWTDVRNRVDPSVSRITRIRLAWADIWARKRQFR